MRRRGYWKPDCVKIAELEQSPPEGPSDPDNLAQYGPDYVTVHVLCPCSNTNEYIQAGSLRLHLKSRTHTLYMRRLRNDLRRELPRTFKVKYGVRTAAGIPPNAPTFPLPAHLQRQHDILQENANDGAHEPAADRNFEHNWAQEPAGDWGDRDELSMDVDEDNPLIDRMDAEGTAENDAQSVAAPPLSDDDDLDDDRAYMDVSTDSEDEGPQLPYQESLEDAVDDIRIAAVDEGFDADMADALVQLAGLDADDEVLEQLAGQEPAEATRTPLEQLEGPVRAFYEALVGLRVGYYDGQFSKTWLTFFLENHMTNWQREVDPKSAPIRTFYKFKKVTDMLCSATPDRSVSCYETSTSIGGKRKLRYRSLAACLEQILSEPKVLAAWTNRDNCNPGHPVAGERFSYICDNILQDKLREADVEACGIVLFVDGFQQVKFAKLGYESISIGVINASLDVQHSLASKSLLMVVPTGCDLMEAVRKCFIEPLLELRNAAPRLYGKHPLRLVPFLFALLGDDPGLRKLSLTGGWTNPNALNRWLKPIPTGELALEHSAPSSSSLIAMIENSDLARTRSIELLPSAEAPNPLPSATSSSIPSENVESSLVIARNSMDVDDEVATPSALSRASSSVSVESSSSRRSSRVLRPSLVMRDPNNTLPAPPQRRNPSSSIGRPTPSQPLRMAPRASDTSVSVTSSNAPTAANSGAATPKARGALPAPIPSKDRELRSSTAIVTALKDLDLLVTDWKTEQAQQPGITGVKPSKALATRFRALLPNLATLGLKQFGSSLVNAEPPVLLGLDEMAFDYVAPFLPCLLHNIDLGLIVRVMKLCGSRLTSTFQNQMNDMMTNNADTRPPAEFRTELFKNGNICPQKGTWYRRFFVNHWLNLFDAWVAKTDVSQFVPAGIVPDCRQLCESLKKVVELLYSRTVDYTEYFDQLNERVFDFKTRWHQFDQSPFPNIETIDAYLHLSRKFGLPIFWSTQRYEAIHLVLRKLARFTNSRDVARDMVVRSADIALSASLNDRTIPSQITPNNHPNKALFKPRSQLRSRTALLETRQDEELTNLYNSKVFSIEVYSQLHQIVGFAARHRLYAFDHCPPDKKGNCLAQLVDPASRRAVDVVICNIVTLRYVGGGQQSRYSAILAAPLLPRRDGDASFVASMQDARWYSANDASSLISKLLLGSTHRYERSVFCHFFTPWTSEVAQSTSY